MAATRAGCGSRRSSRFIAAMSPNCGARGRIHGRSEARDSNLRPLSRSGIRSHSAGCRRRDVFLHAIKPRDGPGPGERARDLAVRSPGGRSGPRRFKAHRGVEYWESGDRSDRRILFGTFDGRLIALDARTGKPCEGFGDSGSVDLRAGVADSWPDAAYGVTSPPAIYQQLAIVGAELPEYPSKGPSGSRRANDLHGQEDREAVSGHRRRRRRVFSRQDI